MKFFIFLLSFYLLALSCYPCGDRQECISKENQKISAAAGEHPQQPQDEACTPFCSCACCVASAFYQSLSFITIPDLAFQFQKYPHYIADFCSAESYSIWQPPKLG